MMKSSPDERSLSASRFSSRFSSRLRRLRVKLSEVGDAAPTAPIGVLIGRIVVGGTAWSFVVGDVAGSPAQDGTEDLGFEGVGSLHHWLGLVGCACRKERETQAADCSGCGGNLNIQGDELAVVGCTEGLGFEEEEVANVRQYVDERV